MNPQDPNTIQPHNQPLAPLAPPPPVEPLAPAAPHSHSAPTQHHDPLGLSSHPDHAQPHIPAPHTMASDHHPKSESEPAKLPHIAPVTAGSRPIMVTLSIAALFLSLVGTFILYFTNVSTKSRIERTTQSIADLNAQLDAPPLLETNKKLTVINRALAGYKAASASKINYKQFFDSLPNLTPKDMRISALAIDAAGAVRITATGTSFDTAGKSLLSFGQSSALSEVMMESIGLAGSEEAKIVNFELTAKLNAAKLTTNASSDTSTTNQ